MNVTLILPAIWKNAQMEWELENYPRRWVREMFSAQYNYWFGLHNNNE